MANQPHTKLVTIAAITGAVVVVIIWMLLRPHQTVVSPLSTAVNQSAHSTTATFSPADLIPLAFAPKGQFIIATQPNSHLLYRLEKDGQATIIHTLPATVLNARLSPDENNVLVVTGSEAGQQWQIIKTTTDKQITDLSHIRAADWKDDQSLIAVTDQGQVVQEAVGDGSNTKRPAQPTIPTGTDITVEYISGQTLIGATSTADEAASTQYWVITDANKVVSVPFSTTVQAHLSPSGLFVLASIITDKVDEPIHLFNIKEAKTGTLDPRLSTTSLTGAAYKADDLISNTNTSGSQWQIARLGSDAKANIQTITAPILWPAHSFFLADTTLFAMGQGNLYTADISALLSK